MRASRRIRGGWPEPGPWREGAITAPALTLYLLGAATEPDDELGPPLLAAYPLAAVSCAVLALRHRMPRTTVAVTTAGGVLTPSFGLDFNPLLMVPVMVAIYTFALHQERHEAKVTIGASMTLLALSSLVLGADSPLEAGTASTVAFPLLAGALGTSTRNRRDLLAATEERARRAEQSRESEARRRVVEERMRIARELHDVVAHHMTLAHAQAAVTALFFDSRPEVARESLGQLTENTSNALDELRATLGLLRQSGDSGEPLDPAPGLAELPRLVESFQRAGLTVSMRQDGPARPLSPGVDLTAYRIVQEALTNVTKHAATSPARVHLAYDHDRLTITVTDDGPRAATAPGHPPGYGLIGMRERAGAAGGRLSAGPRPEGGYRVAAELPLPPPRDRGGADAPGGRTPR